MFKNMKIGMRLGLGFAVVLALLATLAYVSISRLAEMSAAVSDITHDKYMKVQLLQQGLAGVNTIALGSRDMVIASTQEGRQAAKESVLGGRASIGKAWEALKPTLTLPKGIEMMQQILESRENFIAAQNQVIKLVEEGKLDEAKNFLDTDYRKIAVEYRTRVNNLIAFQAELMDKTAKEAEAAYQQARTLLIAVAIAAFLFAVSIGFWVTRSVTKPIGEAVSVANRMAEGDLTVKIDVTSNDETGKLLTAMGFMVDKLSQVIAEVRGAADNLSSASEEVSATAQSLSQSSSEQAASVEETSSSIEQMSASIAQNTENAKITDSMASQAAKQAAEGGVAVTETVAAMKQIAGKIGIIDDIAYQTNLLALNAAIEAARAGEHGKGFAVVAAEVRKLAERSQVAAQEIGELASGSVQKAESAGKLLNEMVPTISKTSDLVQEITAASEEQSSGVGQINSAMSQLNQATQQNASASEELAATAEEMSSQAGQLQETISFFKVDAAGGGTNTRGTFHAAAKLAHKPAAHSAKPTANAPAFDESEFVKF